MSDIVKAMDIENEYQVCRANGRYPYHLLDKIKDCGFESLEEYFETKRDYQFNHLDFTFIEVSQEEIIPEIKRILAQKLTGVQFFDSPVTCVFNGFSGDASFNLEYCIKNDIVVLPLLTGGGTIVHQAGDFSWGVCCPSDININSQYILDGVRNILQKYTDKNVAVDGNDILVDGNKVCGSTTYNNNGTFLFVSYYSFNDKTELISNICNKVSGKIPGYIDFMTKAEFKQEVSKWLRVNSI